MRHAACGAGGLHRSRLTAPLVVSRRQRVILVSVAFYYSASLDVELLAAAVA